MNRYSVERNIERYSIVIGDQPTHSGKIRLNMVAEKLNISREAVTEFCRRHHIRRLALFGSILRDDFAHESDVDVLVEFEPGHEPGLAFFTMQEELSEIFGSKVDLSTRDFLSEYFRDQVVAEADNLYVAPE